MDASSLLIDTYKRYKTGTKAFVQWLATAARATGTVDDIFAVPTSGTLEGKAREDNKNQQQTPTKAFQVPLRHLAKLAEAVVAHPNATVPPSMFTILRDVISKRKDCVVFYRSPNTKVAKAAKNQIEGHEYCITVFGNVLATLVKKEVKAEFKKVRITHEPGRLSNVFSSLELEDTFEDENEEDQVYERQQASTVEEYVMERTPEEIKFALFCLFKDATDIRLFVRRTWRLYKSGSVSLETAAMTMNIAISIIESLDKALLRSFPTLPAFKEHFSIHEFIIGQRWHPDVSKVPGGVPEYWKAYSDGVQELSYPSLTCMHTSILMANFLAAPISRGLRPTFDIDAAVYPLTTEEVTFWKTLVQLSVLCCETSKKAKLRVMVLKAMDEVFEHKLYPTWAVFAFQCIRDTQLELGNSIGRGIEKFRDTSQPIANAFMQYLDSEVGTSYAKNPEVIARVKDKMEYRMYRDPIVDIAKLRKWSQDGLVFDRQFLLGQLPVLCGLYAQEDAMRMQQWATTTMTSQDVIKAVAHLYNAARSTGFLSTSMVWEDLEYLLQEFGEDFIFEGPRPRHDSDFHRCFNLACGYRTSKSTTTHRLSKKEVQKCASHRGQRKSRRLRFLSKYVHICTDVKGGRIKDSDACDDPGKLLQSLLVIAEPRTTNKKNMSPVEMLSKIRETLQHDQCRLHFNITTMWLRCYKLLRSILDHVMLAAPRDYPVSEYGYGLAPMMVVSSLLSERAGSATLDAPQFAAAVQIMRQVISTEGDVECKAVAAFDGGGTMVEDKEPSFENPLEDNIGWKARLGCCNPRDRNQPILFERGDEVKQVFTTGYHFRGQFIEGYAPKK